MCCLVKRQERRSSKDCDLGDRFWESRNVGALKCANELGGEGVTRATNTLPREKQGETEEAETMKVGAW